MTYTEAVSAAKSGSKPQRKGWGITFLQFAPANSEGNKVEFLATYNPSNNDRRFHQPSQDDAKTTDWCILADKVGEVDKVAALDSGVPVVE